MPTFTHRTGVLVALCIFGFALGTGCTGSTSSSSTANSTVSGAQRTAYAHVTILDAKGNRWWGDSQLYLKVESSLEPGTGILLPINVGPNRGLVRSSHKTPFVLRSGKNETLHMEWFDDQTLTAAQSKAILDTFEAGGYVVTVGGQMYLMASGVPTGGPELPAAMGKLARSSGTLLLGDPDVRNFENLGKADYNVLDNPPDSYQAANPTVILTGKNAKAEIRFYYPTAEAK